MSMRIVPVVRRRFSVDVKYILTPLSTTVVHKLTWAGKLGKARLLYFAPEQVIVLLRLRSEKCSTTLTSGLCKTAHEA